MTKLFQKVLSILCVIALLVSGIVMAFAEEADEAPVWDETQQSEAETEAAWIAAEEAEAARIAAEQAEAARIAAEEEAARIAAEEEAARIAAEEAEAARIAAEEEEARRAAEEEEARKAAEEEAARKAAEEEAARQAAEEEEARKAAEEEEARKAAEEEEARKAAEEEEASKAAEEEEASKAAEEEEPREADEEQATQEAPGTESSNNEVVEDQADENGYYEFDDSWGYVDPDIISEKTPEITDKFKGLRSASMNVNEILSDTISFGDELIITLKCGSAQTVDLKFYTDGDVNVKVDDKAVAFTPADSDDPAFAMSIYVLENTAGRTHKISLSAGNTVSFKLAAVAEQTEVQDVTPWIEEVAPVEGNNEEPASSEDTDKTDTEIAEIIENIENTENSDTNTENGENTETTENNEDTDTDETTENIETIETNEATQNENDNTNEETIDNIQSIEPIEPTIQVSMKTYSAMKIGGSISDKLVGGQKAKLQVKCGKHQNVKLILNSNPDDITVKIEGTDTEFTQEADGTYTIELDEVAFRKFNIVLAAKQDLEFTLAVEAEGEAEEENKEENAEDTNNEETEPAKENTEEKPEETTEEMTGETEETEKNDGNTDKVTGENAESEKTTEEAEVTEEETVEEDTEIKTDDDGTEAVNENTEESGEPEVIEYDLTVHSTLDDRGVSTGEICTLTADASAYEGMGEIVIRWYYSDDGRRTWNEIENANDLVYQFIMGDNNWYYRWKATATITIFKVDQAEGDKSDVPGTDMNAGDEVEGLMETAMEEPSNLVADEKLVE